MVPLSATERKRTGSFSANVIWVWTAGEDTDERNTFIVFPPFSNTTGLTSCYSCPNGFTSNNARTGCETSLRLLDSSSKNSNSPIVQNCHKCSYGSYSASMDSKSYNSYPKGTSISLDRKGFVHSDKGGTSQYLNWNERYYFDRVVCIIFKRCSTFYYSSKKIYKK